jgi:hypothetical protein
MNKTTREVITMRPEFSVLRSQNRYESVKILNKHILILVADNSADFCEGMYSSAAVDSFEKLSDIPKLFSIIDGFDGVLVLQSDFSNLVFSPLAGDHGWRIGTSSAAKRKLLFEWQRFNSFTTPPADPLVIDANLNFVTKPDHWYRQLLKFDAISDLNGIDDSLALQTFKELVTLANLSGTSSIDIPFNGIMYEMSCRRIRTTYEFIFRSAEGLSKGEKEELHNLLQSLNSSP